MDLGITLVTIVVTGIIGGIVGWFSRGRLWLAVVGSFVTYFLLVVVLYAYFSRPGSLTLASLRREFHAWSTNYPRYFWMHPVQELFDWLLPVSALLFGALWMHSAYRRSRHEP